MRRSFLVVVLLAASAYAQVIQTGATGPDYCYKIEKIAPNLILEKEIRVFGTVKDQSGAPFRNSRVELRKYVSQRKQNSERVVVTDEEGHFELGIVKPGSYRLLASPNRTFKQPSALQCHDANSCEFQITLIRNATDQLDASCPIR